MVQNAEKAFIYHVFRDFQNGTKCRKNGTKGLKNGTKVVQNGTKVVQNGTKRSSKCKIFVKSRSICTILYHFCTTFVPLFWGFVPFF